MRKLFQWIEVNFTSVEYGLIATLIGVGIIAGATTLGTALNSTFNDVSTEIQSSD